MNAYRVTGEWLREMTTVEEWTESPGGGAVKSQIGAPIWREISGDLAYHRTYAQAVVLREDLEQRPDFLEIVDNAVRTATKRLVVFVGSGDAISTSRVCARLQRSSQTIWIVHRWTKPAVILVDFGC